MLNQHFKDILLCLRNESVEFIVVGAYALAAHGYPRATGDIDIWINRSAENSKRTFRALDAFGAPLSELTPNAFTTANMVFQIGVEPSRIDILTGIDGVNFDDAWRNKVSTIVDDIVVDIISKADLLINKQAAGRDKDQSDIAWLRKH
jgi:hypothetical protein